ncbi:ABC transporter permease [Bacillus sp. Hm123]|uniref:ABC transporter permease n=1 Tax=Bacillus sp. Hm123 TaxID=3450745 RepID=UPI003F423054
MTIFTTIYNHWRSFFTFMILIVLWVLVAKQYPAVVIPGPYETVQALEKLIKTGVLWDSLSITLLRFGVGFSIALFLGCGLGVLSGLNTNACAFIRPAVLLLQAIPPISWILLAIIWLGVDGGSQVLVVTIALFPVFFFNSVEGIRQVSKPLLEMAYVFRVSRLKQIRDIYLPALLPFWLSALTINIGVGWKTVVMAELISGYTGIGASMNSARIYLETAEVMAWTFVVVLLGMGIEATVRACISRRKRNGI